MIINTTSNDIYNKMDLAKLYTERDEVMKLDKKDLIEKHYKLEKKSTAEGSEMNEKFEQRVFHFIRK